MNIRWYIRTKEIVCYDERGEPYTKFIKEEPVLQFKLYGVWEPIPTVHDIEEIKDNNVRS